MSLASAENLSNYSQPNQTPSLADRLRKRIERKGPITFRDWMEAALYDPNGGYYCRPDKLRQGRTGDYRTAPETSTLFGQTFARYFMKSYFDLGAPDVLTIAEVGAGRGDFAIACLSALQANFPEVLAATRYFIDELSPEVRLQARVKLAAFMDRVEFRSGAEFNAPLPHLIIFSNELLDAFPVHRIVNRKGTLCELFVDSNEHGNFTWVEDEITPHVAAYCEGIKLELKEGQVYEVNLGVEDFISRAACLIENGLLVTVDYGAERKDLLTDPNRFAGTLRSFHRHRLSDDVLSHPGEQDLTTTVDWTQVMEAGTRNGFETLRLQRLNEFLISEGALEDIGIATRHFTDSAELFNYNAGARELIMPDGLAGSFQVLVQRKE